MKRMKTVLLCIAAALFCFAYPANSTGLPQYVHVGCFRDEPQDRALPKLLRNYRGNLDWDNLEQIVEKCAREAEIVQFYGECWSGGTAYDKYGPSTECTPAVGKEYTNQVYRLVGDERECKDYSTFNEGNRSVAFHSPLTSTPFCDDRLTPGWYRFLPPAGNQMASTCVPTKRCGTAVTGWLQTMHPNMTDGVISGRVCFHWKTCCQFSQDIQVRNCGRFFVYKLDKTVGCPMRFCGEDIL